MTIKKKDNRKGGQFSRKDNCHGLSLNTDLYSIPENDLLYFNIIMFDISLGNLNCSNKVGK